MPTLALPPTAPPGPPPVHPSSSAPAYATRPPAVLPGPNATPATIGTALTVLTAATETIMRIDSAALRDLMTRHGVIVPDEMTRMVDAAATFRGHLIGALPGPAAELDRLTAWLAVHAPDRLRGGQPIAETIIGLLTEARDAQGVTGEGGEGGGAAGPPRTAQAVTLPPPHREARRRAKGGGATKAGAALAVVPKTTP